MPDIQLVLTRLDPKALTFLSMLAMVMLPVTLMVIVGTVADAWRRLGTARAECRLKDRMIERGMSADEIVRVVTARGPDAEPRPAVEQAPTLACEAAVRRDDELVPALLLARGGGQYFVHYVGTDMDENEWVDASRVLLPPEHAREDDLHAWSHPAKPAPFDRDA